MTRTVWDCLPRLRAAEESESTFAILILNQPILCQPQLINSLWNKAVLRVLVDGGSNRWLDFLEGQESRSLRCPDFISGDFDSIKPRTRSYFDERGVTFIPTPDQDETDFTKALRCIAGALKRSNSKVEFVVVVCENSGRFDQIMGNVNTLHRSRSIVGDTPVLILSSQSVTWVLPPGDHTICVTKAYVEEQYSCGLIPFCGPTVITTRGLKWDVENRTSQMGGLVSTSNTFADTRVHITCNQNLVWTTEYSKIEQ